MTAEILEIGDRVIITGIRDETTGTDVEEYRQAVVGKEGTVTYVPPNDDRLYDVDFDEPIGNDGYESVRHFFLREEIERLH